MAKRITMPRGRSGLPAANAATREKAPASVEMRPTTSGILDGGVAKDAAKAEATQDRLRNLIGGPVNERGLDVPDLGSPPAVTGPARPGAERDRLGSVLRDAPASPTGANVAVDPKVGVGLSDQDRERLRGLLVAGGMPSSEIDRVLGGDAPRAGAHHETPGTGGSDLQGQPFKRDTRAGWFGKTEHTDETDSDGNQKIVQKEFYRQDDGTTLEIEQTHENGRETLEVTLKDADGHVIESEETTDEGTSTSRPTDHGAGPRTLTQADVDRVEARREGLVDPAGPDAGHGHDVERLARGILLLSQSKVNPAPDGQPGTAGEDVGPPTIDGLVHVLGPSTPTPTTRGPRPQVGPGVPLSGGATGGDGPPQ